MFEFEKNGYKKSEVDYYIRRLDDDFQAILGRNSERLENVKRNISELAIELDNYTQVVPQYKSEIESLRERLENIRGIAEKSSQARYLSKKEVDLEAVLANLITKILEETGDLHELKIIEASAKKQIDNDDFFEILASSRDIRLDDALSGFDFFDNNPYKERAEKTLKKIEAKKNKRAK